MNLSNTDVTGGRRYPTRWVSKMLLKWYTGDSQLKRPRGYPFAVPCVTEESSLPCYGQAARGTVTHLNAMMMTRAMMVPWRKRWLMQACSMTGDGDCRTNAGESTACTVLNSVRQLFLLP